MVGFSECVLFRCMMIFSWKKYAMMNDEFFATFLSIFNFMIGQMISIIRLKFGDHGVLFNGRYEFLSGRCITTIHEKRYKNNI